MTSDCNVGTAARARDAARRPVGGRHGWPIGGALGAAAALVLCGAAACATSVVAGAPGDDESAAILSKVRAALGTEALKAQATGVWVRGETEFLGMKGKYSLLFDGHGSFVEEQHGASGADMASGFDGTTSWEVALGGTPRVLVLGDRDLSLMSSAFRTGLWADESSGLRFTVEDGDASDGEVALAFTREGGPLTGRVMIDAEEWRPRVCEWTTGPSTQTLRIEEWGEIGGARVAKRAALASSTGMSSRYDAETIGPAPVFIRNPYEPRLSRPVDVRFGAGEGGARGPLEVRKTPTGHLLVHPTLNGEDVGWFIFDTGAGSNVVTPAVAERLGLEPIGQVKAVGLGGPVDSGFWRAKELSLGPATIQQPMFIGLDLAFLTPHMGVEIAGIVGFDFLSRVAARIDMADGTIELHDPETFELPAGAAWQELMVYGRVPCVEARFEGHQGPFKLDTGAAQMSVTFHAPAVERLALLDGRDDAQDARLGGVGGFVQAKAARVAWFELGGRRFEPVTATFALEGKGAFADPYTLGNIGGKLIGEFVLVVDYGGRRIALIEREQPPR